VLEIFSVTRDEFERIMMIWWCRLMCNCAAYQRGEAQGAERRADKEH